MSDSIIKIARDRRVLALQMIKAQRNEQKMATVAVKRSTQARFQPVECVLASLDFSGRFATA